MSSRSESFDCPRRRPRYESPLIVKPERYRHPALRQLAEQQVRFAPVAVRLAQLERTELFLLDVQPDAVVLYPALVQAITSRSTDIYPQLEITGQAILHDLKCFVEDLSETLNLDAAAAAEPVLTQDEVSEQFKVSLKTVSRWRDRGLVGRRYRFGTRRRIGFLKSHVERYVATHQEAVARGTKFTLLSASEREWIIRRARRLARYGASQTDIIHRLSKRTGRATETIRYSIKSHDSKFPNAAIFPDAPSPITDSIRRDIYHAMKRGDSPTKLARQYGRTRSTMHRVAKEYRAELLLKQPIECSACDEFEAENADELILNPPPELNLPQLESPDPKTRSEVSGYASDLSEFPVLTREQEYFLFRKMNYVRHQAIKLRAGLAKSKTKVADMNQIEQLLEQSLEVKNVLIRCNLRLVMSVARKHERGSGNFLEMVSDGNLNLIRAIELFDYSRGFKFSTYASWALMRLYAKSASAEGVRSDRFQTGTEEVIVASHDDRGSVGENESRIVAQSAMIESFLDQLTEREQEAISLRFALRGHAVPLTLEQIGDRLGVTKERTRQIISAGLDKLRDIAQRTTGFEE